MLFRQTERQIGRQTERQTDHVPWGCIPLEMAPRTPGSLICLYVHVCACVCVWACVVREVMSDESNVSYEGWELYHAFNVHTGEGTFLPSQVP